MKKKIFLSKNRRRINISTNKYGRKSKKGKNSKLNKRSKRVKIVNTNMQKNQTKKSRRNIQKGGVWFEVTQGTANGSNETVWYDVNKNNPGEDTRDLKRTWRKFRDHENRDYWVNDATKQRSWTLPPPNPAFELGYVSPTPHYHASLPPHSTQQQPDASFHSKTPEETESLSSILGLLFQPTITKDENTKVFLSRLQSFSEKNPTLEISKVSVLQSNGKSQTILYAACRTIYVSQTILDILIHKYKCDPGASSGERFYPLGALMASLYDNIKPGEYFDTGLVGNYIAAIKILFDFYSEFNKNNDLMRLKEQKNSNGLTAYDDFVTLFLYNFISDCSQLNEIIKLLLVNSHSHTWRKATILFQVCNASIIYPGLIKKLIISCGNDVNEISELLIKSDHFAWGEVDPENSGYPITALIKSYDRIKRAGGDVSNCKDAIRIVSGYTDMTKLTPKQVMDIQSIVS